jgi:hypothetical protein
MKNRREGAKKWAGDHPQGGDYRPKIKLHISGAFAGERIERIVARAIPMFYRH